MGDVSKALILPDIHDPDPEAVRNLALYWDEIVCPNYDDLNLYLESDDLLIREGVVQPLERKIAEEKVFPTAENFDENEAWSYHFSRDSGGEIKVELVNGESGLPSASLGALSDSELEAIAAIELGRQLGFIDDSFAIAAENNLAPVSHSLGGHLAAVVGSSGETEGDLASREAALLSVVVESFTLDPSVTSEEVLAFRSRSSRSQARLRASLVDLASKLRTSSSPTMMLAEARDTYKNRVEPALGDLEEALKESQLKFFLKSLVGATAIVIAPIEPVSTSVGAARVLGQSIDYTYSKSRLLREHPYGYLHEINQNFVGASSNSQGREELAATMRAPRESLAKMWLEYWRDAREFDRDAEGS